MYELRSLLSKYTFTANAGYECLMIMPAETRLPCLLPQKQWNLSHRSRITTLIHSQSRITKFPWSKINASLIMEFRFMSGYFRWFFRQLPPRLPKFFYPATSNLAVFLPELLLGPFLRWHIRVLPPLLSFFNFRRKINGRTANDFILVSLALDEWKSFCRG